MCGVIPGEESAKSFRFGDEPGRGVSPLEISRNRETDTTDPRIADSAIRGRGGRSNTMQDSYRQVVQREKRLLGGSKGVSEHRQRAQVPAGQRVRIWLTPVERTFS
jgi:hypothetical protein